MPWLARLWMPYVKISSEELGELQAALPNTIIYAPPDDIMGSTGGGWREDQSYYDMRDIMGMPYLPGGTGKKVPTLRSPNARENPAPAELGEKLL